MGSPKGNAPTSVYVDDLAQMASAPGVDPAALQWWTNAIGGTQMRYVLTISDFCAGPHPVYPDMTVDNILADGLVMIFHLWIVEYLYSLWCYDS